MPEFPRGFGEDVVKDIALLEEARSAVLHKVAEGPIHENDLLEHVSRSLYAYQHVGLYALSSLDGLREEKGVISLSDSQAV